MAGRFDGKVAWITGGGSGIGRACALEFAGEGARVAVSGRRRERLDEVVRDIEGRGGEALAVPCDVTDEDGVAEAVRAVVERFGRLDVVLANAGYGVGGAIEKLSAEDWRRQLDVNVVGLVTTVRHALPELRETGGRIGLVGSVNAFVFTPKMGAYCASKAAVRAIGEVLAAELRGSGVSCTTVHPGFVESEIARVDKDNVHHPDRKDKRPSNLMWPADKAARVIVRAVHRRQREKVFTGHGKVAAWLGRHTPGLVNRLVSRG
ncbi:MAG: SDR family NAD(P)-dependent oxidoreductase [Myxococcota bacterium]